MAESFIVMLNLFPNSFFDSIALAYTFLNVILCAFLFAPFFYEIKFRTIKRGTEFLVFTNYNNISYEESSFILFSIGSGAINLPPDVLNTSFSLSVIFKYFIINHNSNITSMEPTFFIKNSFSFFRLVVITKHNIWTFG